MPAPMRRETWLLPVLAPLLAGCTGPQPPAEQGAAACEGTFPATVEHIVDGDTLDVAQCGRIRLALVDTPERDEPGFEEATAFTASLCPLGVQATVDQDAGQPVDTTGTRFVAVVLCGGQHLNAELVASGHAVILKESCAVSEFADEPWAAEACASA